MQLLGIGWLYKGNEVIAIKKTGITTQHEDGLIETPLGQINSGDCQKPQDVTT